MLLDHKGEEIRMGTGFDCAFGNRLTQKAWAKAMLDEIKRPTIYDLFYYRIVDQHGNKIEKWTQ